MSDVRYLGCRNPREEDWKHIINKKLDDIKKENHESYKLLINMKYGDKKRDDYINRIGIDIKEHREEFHEFTEKFDRELLFEIHEIHSQYESVLKKVNLIGKDINPKDYNGQIKIKLNDGKTWDLLKSNRKYKDTLIYLQNGHLFHNLLFSENIKLKNIDIIECTPLAIDFYKALESFLYTRINLILDKGIKAYIKEKGKYKEFDTKDFSAKKPTFGNLLFYINSLSSNPCDRTSGVLLKNNKRRRWCKDRRPHFHDCENWHNIQSYDKPICYMHEKYHCVKYRAEKWLKRTRNSNVHRKMITAEKAPGYMDELIQSTLRLITDFNDILLEE